MADEVKKGVIVEFDFAVMNGAELLYRTAAALLKESGVAFDARVEARHLAGGNYQGGLAEYFAVAKTKKTPQKAAKDLADGFRKALEGEFPKAVTPAFRNFVKVLADRGLKVVIATRANLDVVRPAFGDILGDAVVLYQEVAQTYGSVKWDAWRRALVMNKLRNTTTLAVTGSGYGVKSALIAGMGAVAVTNDRVAYQDFGGADEVFKVLDSAAARAVLKIMRAG